ncbi:DUF1189 family protein [Vagococcus zengguangii]|uniref:DUF1189 domain-containing protein n=1 Tax=Vagococcus zengguangii TaxID=2571750 RepID=A0A4D7CPL7_9ENTE|nr:DUF1189 family protein [Vagococcus zengguangii]QCI86028.1 DUF1189 domain-containing protein [Vagococcus zengguangii]TLG80228.1 DUF1189 domain-containing protein [Vagococcus zengguangii]
MNIFKLFKEAILHPQNLFLSNRLSKKVVIPYFLLLTLILSLPLMFLTFNQTKQVENSIQEIVRQTPAFTFEDNQLATKEASDSFLYESDYLLYVFDPEDKLTAKDVKDRLVGNQIGLGYLKDELMIAVNDNNPFISLIGKNILTISYKNIDQDYFSQVVFKTAQIGASQRTILALTILLLTWIPTMITFALYLLLGTLIGHTFERARVLGLKLNNSYKLFMVASTLPVIASTILSIFFPSLDSLSLIIMVTVVIYAHNIRQIKKQIINSQDKNN